MLQVGINIIGLFPGKIGGGEQYIRNIILQLEQRKDAQIHLFLNSDGYKTFQTTERLSLYRIKIEENIDTQLLYYIDYLNLDLWFCPLFHLIPANCPIPSATTIFDIQQEYFPKNFSRSELYYRRRYTKATLEKSDIILTISDFSKKTLIDKYSVAPDKIQVTHLDADNTFNQPRDESEKRRIKDRYSLPEQFLIYPANTWPHKNHMRLLKAFRLLKETYGDDLKIVFTGAKKARNHKMNQYIRRHNLLDDVIFLGYIPQEDMPGVMANANMLVFPSLFEGFGIPLIEAMRVKIPVCSSRYGSIPEIGTNAVHYFDAYNSKDMAQKIHECYTNEALRTHLIDAGEFRQTAFSWAKCADETITHLLALVPGNPIPAPCQETQPLVSVITPSYNQGEFIRETIESVLSQDYPNLEYIVMDGGSTDDTISILKEYGDRIQWVSEKDGGQADAVNKGIAVAKGDIIGWLNSDDTYVEGAVSTAVEFLLSHPNTDMVYGEGYYTDKDTNIVGNYATEKFNVTRLAETCIICQPTAFFKKSIVKEVGGLDSSLHLCMDYELWMKIAFAGHISYIPEYLACSRMYEENKTLSRRSEVYREVCATVRKYYQYVPISWVTGYAHYISGSNNRFVINMLRALLFTRYNLLHNPKYYFITVAKYFIRNNSLPTKVETEGVFIDGWVSGTYVDTIYVKEPFGRILIKGQHHWPMDTPLVIAVSINDVPVGQVEIAQKGEFCEEITFQEQTAGQSTIKLLMNKTFVPSKMGMSNDSRRLSFMLEKIDLL